MLGRNPQLSEKQSVNKDKIRKTLKVINFKFQAILSPSWWSIDLSWISRSPSYTSSAAFVFLTPSASFSILSFSLGLYLVKPTDIRWAAICFAFKNFSFIPGFPPPSACSPAPGTDLSHQFSLHYCGSGYWEISGSKLVSCLAYWQSTGNLCCLLSVNWKVVLPRVS